MQFAKDIGPTEESTVLQVPLESRKKNVLEQMAAYHGQTLEQFVLESLDMQVEGVLDNPRILGEHLTERLRTQYP